MPLARPVPGEGALLGRSPGLRIVAGPGLAKGQDQYPTFAAALVQKADTYYWQARFMLQNDKGKETDLQVLAINQQATVAQLTDLGWKAVDLSKLPAED